MRATPSLGDRRRFLAAAGGFCATVGLGRSLRAAPLPSLPPLSPPPQQLFRISLAQWSLHRALFAKELDNLDFPAKAASFGVTGVEFVNAFWKDKAADAAYLKTLRQRCADAGVQPLLIMCDGEGALGDPDAEGRGRAVEAHRRWLAAAKALGCHSIRVNAESSGTADEQQKLVADGLRRLCVHGDELGIDVIVENHGGLSSNGKWLAATLRAVQHPRCGSLPDFGNFRIDADTTYDRYQGIDELMPLARGVSAKSHDFDERGNEIHTDYRRMLDLVVNKHRYAGFIGIEYEGSKRSEADGIRATKHLLDTVQAELIAQRDAAAKRAADAKAGDQPSGDAGRNGGGK